MKQPPEPTRSNETTVTILLIVFVAGLLLLITLAAFALGDTLGLSPSLPVPPTTAATLAAPTLFIPTVDCGSPALTLGTVTLQIQNTQRSADGLVSVPPDSSGIAYRVEGTGQPVVLMLSPTAENLNLLTSLPEGTAATVTGGDCTSMTFTLSAPQPGDFGTAAALDPSAAGLLLFLQLDPTGEGFMASGSLAEEVISVLNTPAPDESGVLAEVGLVEVASDGSTLTLTVSIYNFGGEPFTLSAENVSLTPPGAAPLAVERSSPRLPERIDPAETETFTFTFPRPSTATATLKVFTVEYEVEGY